MPKTTKVEKILSSVPLYRDLDATAARRMWVGTPTKKRMRHDPVNWTAWILGVTPSSLSEDQKQALKELSRPETSTIAALEKLLCEVNVLGDGSCWVYAFLAHFGMVKHIVDDDGKLLMNPRPRTLPEQEEEWSEYRAGVQLRRQIGEWFDKNNGFERLYDMQKRAKEAKRLQSLRDPPPCPPYNSMHAFGGNDEFVAVADLSGCYIFTYMQGDEAKDPPKTRGTLFCPGRFERGRGKAIPQTMAQALQECRKDARGLPLLCLKYYTNHWHTLLPCDAGRRFIQRRTELDGAYFLRGKHVE